MVGDKPNFEHLVAEAAKLFPTTPQEVHLEELQQDFDRRIGAAEALPESLSDSEAAFVRLLCRVDEQS